MTERGTSAHRVTSRIPGTDCFLLIFEALPGNPGDGKIEEITTFMEEMMASEFLMVKHGLEQSCEG